MTWQVYFTPSRRGGMGMFLNVAKHVIADLGYNRPTDQHETHNDEERRALVACFALSAMTALAIKAEPMRWSASIARACDRLAQNVDNNGDAVLVAMARISRVSVDAYNTIQQILDDPASASHAVSQVRALRTMLDMVKSSFTHAQQQDSMVLCYLYSTEVQIHEAVLYDLSPPPSNTLDLQRIEYLTACLHACKASLDNYLTIPSITMNMVTVLAFSNSCQVLYTLSVIDYLGWDRNAARATADVLWYFDHVCIRFEEACRQLQQESGSDDNVYSLAGGHEGLKAVSAKWRESLETATGSGTVFAAGLGSMGDMWMTNADMW
ncbi:hypothetical protein N0V90_006934 [Kalmusia sp. IMI 367209]|nr:hypothetical protein N0V90_006934 [Kalmusia sp. IMI 367209]